MNERAFIQFHVVNGHVHAIFTKNIAFGGDVKKSATSAYTAGSERQAMRIEGHETRHEEDKSRDNVEKYVSDLLKDLFVNCCC